VERDQAMALAVGIPGELFSAAEAEMRSPRIANRPAAVVALKIDELFRLIASGVSCHDPARTRGFTAVTSWDSWELMTSPLRAEQSARPPQGARRKKMGRGMGHVSAPPPCPARGTRWCRATPTVCSSRIHARFGSDIERHERNGCSVAFV